MCLQMVMVGAGAGKPNNWNEILSISISISLSIYLSIYLYIYMVHQCPKSILVSECVLAFWSCSFLKNKHRPRFLVSPRGLCLCRWVYNVLPVVPHKAVARSFKNRKPIGEVGCCESGMAEWSHWWIERCLISLTLSPSFSDYLLTYLSIFYVSIYLSIYLSLSFI